MNTSPTHGTCGACFKTHALDKGGRVKRHGWREVWGTRRVGEYGNVNHSGPCFGTGWLPFEASPDCAAAFVERVLFPTAVDLDATLDHLATMPELVYQGITCMMHRTMMHEGTWEVTLRPGDAEGYNLRWRAGVLVADTGSHVPSYAKKHATLVAEAQGQRAGVTAHALYCLDRVATWVPVTTVATADAPSARKAPLLHAWGHNDILAACGRRIENLRGRSTLRFAATPAQVTCPKCLAK